MVRMFQTASLALPIISQIVKMVVDYVDQKDVMTKKLEGTWRGSVDGPKVAKAALERAEELLDYLVKTKQIDSKDKPPKKVLSTLIEAQVSSDKKEKRQSLSHATHDEILKYLDIAVNYTKNTHVNPKVRNEGIKSYGTSETNETLALCKVKVRTLLKSHFIYLEDEALDIYIGSMSGKLLPSIRIE